MRKFVKRIKDLFIKKKPVSMEGTTEKTYMIFIYGDYKGKEKEVEDLVLQLLPIVSSDFIKYNYGEHGVVCHFSTKESFDDLIEYIDMVFNLYINQYFVVEKTDNCFFQMPKNLKDDLLKINDEDNTTKNGKIETRPPRVEFDMIDKEKIFNVFVPLFNSEDFNFPPHEYHEPTIDEILDKITEQGIESITKQERQILENYGKREDRRSENN